MRYRRAPAALILAMSIAGAWLVLRLEAGSAGAASQSRPENWSIQRLEVAIAAGKADAGVWSSYGRRLSEQKRFAAAASAYQRALELNPLDRGAQFNRAISLAQCGAGDQLYTLLKDLVVSDPKTAVDVLERPECGGVLSQQRFVALAADARMQALD